MSPLIYGFGIDKKVDPNKCAKCGADNRQSLGLWSNGPEDTEWATKPVCLNCYADILIDKRNAELAKIKEDETDEKTIIP